MVELRLPVGSASVGWIEYSEDIFVCSKPARRVGCGGMHRIVLMMVVLMRAIAPHTTDNSLYLNL